MIPNYYNPYQQIQQPIQQQQQNGSFIQVQTEQEAYNWAVAPGNCISFKVQNKPLVIEKSMGFSNLESPKIERYRLIKEEVQQEEVSPVMASDLNVLNNEISQLKAEIAALKEKVDKKPSRARKEEETDA